MPALLSTCCLAGNLQAPATESSADPAGEQSLEPGLLSGKPGASDSSAGTEPERTISLYERIWGYATWYDNKDNPVIQRFQFSGRFQLDYARVDADQGNLDEWNIRRFRMGGKATLFHDFTAHGEVNLNPQENDLYQGLTDAYIAWSPNKHMELTAGKHSAPFTMDGQTSSRRLLAVDRGNLANNLWFTTEYAPGVSLAGKPGRWVYHAGAYSAGEADKEFGNTIGGVFGLATVGYDLAGTLEVKEALLRLNYVYNAPENADSGSLYANRPFEQIGSLNFSFATSRWGFRTDLSGGLGYGAASDVWGAMLMPWVNLSEHFQVVTRYTFVRSIDPRGVRLNRYENQVTTARGDEYHEFYLGLNWYLYGHNLKLQTGVDYAHLADRVTGGAAYDGWGWTSGLRLSW